MSQVEAPGAEATGALPAAPAAQAAAAPSPRLGPRDYRVVVLITAVAFLLRLLSPILPDFATNPGSWPPVRVMGLGHPYQAPNGYIFDEVYFAQDACKDLIGRDYFDPEPPLAKLVIAAGIVVSGTWMHYDAGYHHTVTTTGNTTKDNACEAAGTMSGYGTWGWRMASLIFGTALVPLIYLLAFRIRPDRFFATAAALLMTFDGMAFVQSRIAMIDAVALALLLLAYWVFHVHIHARTDKAWWRTATLLGLCVGLSVSAKWTTLAAWGTMLVVLGGGWLLRKNRELKRLPEESVRVGPRDAIVRSLVYVLVLVAIPVAVYVCSYFRYNSIPHCSSVTQAGLEIPAICPADKPAPVALTLSPLNLGGARVWVPTAIKPGQYLHQIKVHDQWAYDYHAHLTATHPYGSKWYTWPLLLRPVAYYYQDSLGFDSLNHAPLRAEVFNLGNPAIWWASIPAIVYCVYAAIRGRKYAPIFIAIAFFAAWLPFSRVTRVMFLYHMFGSLPLMILAVSCAITDLRRWVLRRRRLWGLTGRHLALAYLGTVLLTFIFFYPFWSALPITSESWTQRIWLNVPVENRFFNIQPDTRISWI
jgi:dolichyl-phosphate-mannose-protein mannosyltransferase